ncbi:hypothetical protein X759_27245 [Mesorhizobium sp. LSHC420B00]|nr:hypothetical protein X759_27245 [Mesorhizobium sp. LSHC420B00]
MAFTAFETASRAIWETPCEELLSKLVNFDVRMLSGRDDARWLRHMI